MALKPVTSPDTEAATIALSIDGETVTAKEGRFAACGLFFDSDVW